MPKGPLDYERPFCFPTDLTSVNLPASTLTSEVCKPSLVMTRTRSSLIVCALLLCASAQLARAQDRSSESSEALPNFARVNERLYRGGQPTKEAFKKLADLGVNTIINLRSGDERAASEQANVEAAGLRYFNIPFKRRGRPTEAQIVQVLSLIDDKENGVVFLHCHKGEDRTGMVVALFRIMHDGWTDQQAIREAEQLGMKFWQGAMKDYISDYFRARSRK
jgi:tyrosine-protein phosphatase SIW14